MDAPGAKKANKSARAGSAESDTSAARSRSPNTNPGEHEELQSGSYDGTEGSDTQENDDQEEEEEDEDEGEETDEENEEPRLKYAYLTKHLGSVYRNGDATSTFLVAGDKMVSI